MNSRRRMKPPGPVGLPEAYSNPVRCDRPEDWLIACPILTPDDFTTALQRASCFTRKAPNVLTGRMASRHFGHDIRFEAGSTPLIRNVMLASDLATILDLGSASHPAEPP